MTTRQNSAMRGKPKKRLMAVMRGRPIKRRMAVMRGNTLKSSLIYVKMEFPLKSVLRVIGVSRYLLLLMNRLNQTASVIFMSCVHSMVSKDSLTGIYTLYIY